jgi:hypothetical protein
MRTQKREKGHKVTLSSDRKLVRLDLLTLISARFFTDRGVKERSVAAGSPERGLTHQPAG